MPEFLRKLPTKTSEDTEEFTKRFKDVDETAMDLLRKMLMFDPGDRISVEDAIKHDFFHDLHCEEDEPTTQPVDTFDFDFEKYDLKIEETKLEIYEEISLYHSSKAQKRYIKNRKDHPEGMMHIKYDRLGKPQEKPKGKMRPKRKKSKKVSTTKLKV